MNTQQFSKSLAVLAILLAAGLSGPAQAMGGKRPADEAPAAAPDGAQLAAAGNKLYHQSCYKCHGPRAVSGGTVPDLRHFEGKPEDFVATVQEGRPGTLMPAWKEFLSEPEILKILAYVRSQAESEK